MACLPYRFIVFLLVQVCHLIKPLIKLEIDWDPGGCINTSMFITGRLDIKIFQLLGD